MTKAFVIEHGAGNLLSLSRALVAAGYEDVKRIKDPDLVKDADNLILPGVGSFHAAASSLKTQGLDQAIIDFASKGKHILGICLGMQLLADRSSEHGESIGLGLIPGSVDKIDTPQKEVRFPLPVIGWMKLRATTNNVQPKLYTNSLSRYFYFIHSYEFNVKDVQDLKAVYRHLHQDIPALVERDNVLGVQFHPEKSASAGIEFLKDFRIYIERD